MSEELSGFRIGFWKDDTVMWRVLPSFMFAYKFPYRAVAATLPYRCRMVIPKSFVKTVLFGITFCYSKREMSIFSANVVILL